MERTIRFQIWQNLEVKLLFRYNLLTAIPMKRLPRFLTPKMTSHRYPASVLWNPSSRKGIWIYGLIILSLIALRHHTPKASLTKLKKTTPMWKIFLTLKLWYIVRLVTKPLRYRRMFLSLGFHWFWKKNWQNGWTVRLTESTVRQMDEPTHGQIRSLIESCFLLCCKGGKTASPQGYDQLHQQKGGLILGGVGSLLVDLRVGRRGWRQVS